jgi:hypothetical protein
LTTGELPALFMRYTPDSGEPYLRLVLISGRHLPYFPLHRAG